MPVNMSCYSDNCGRENQNKDEKTNVCEDFQARPNVREIRNLIEQQHFIRGSSYQKVTREYNQRHINDTPVSHRLVQTIRSPGNSADETISPTNNIPNQINEHADVDGQACLACKQSRPRHHNNMRQSNVSQKHKNDGTNHRCSNMHDVDGSQLTDTVRQPLITVTDSSATKKQRSTRENEDNTHRPPRQRKSQTYVAPKQSNKHVEASYYATVRQPPLKVPNSGLGKNEDNTVTELPPIPPKQRNKPHGSKHQCSQFDELESSVSDCEIQPPFQSALPERALLPVKSAQIKKQISEHLQSLADHNQCNRGVKSKQHQSCSVSTPTSSDEENEEFSIQLSPMRQFEFKKRIQNQNKVDKDQYSQSDNYDAMLIEDPAPSIKPPQFRRFICEKLVDNQKEDDIITSGQHRQSDTSNEIMIEDSVITTPPPTAYRTLPSEKLVQNQKNHDMMTTGQHNQADIINQRVIEDPVHIRTPPQVRRVELTTNQKKEDKLTKRQHCISHISDAVRTLRLPERLQCEQVSNRYTHRNQVNDNVENKQTSPNLDIAMQNIQATVNTLKFELQLNSIDESIDVDRAAVNVIKENANANPIENECLQRKVPNMIPTLTTPENKTEPTLYFKVNQKTLMNVVRSLNDTTAVASATSNVNNLEKLLQGIPKEDELYVNINIQLRDKEAQKSEQKCDRIWSSISNDSGMSDYSYFSVPSEFNVLDRKHNGSFKIESKTYYDQNLNKRIEKLYCTLESGNNQTKPTYQYIVEELIQTEYTYIKGLSHMYKDYILVFRKNPTQRLTQMTAFFDIIENLFKSQLAFYNSMYDVANTEDVAKCFIDHQKLFYLYKPYILSITMMNSSKKSLWIEFQADIMRRQRELGTPLGFENYMITPLQRLTRYILFLDKLKDEDVAEGNKLSKIHQLLDFLKNLTQSTNVDVAVLQSIENIPDTVDSIGRFLMQDVFSIKRKCSIPKCVVFLFEAIIIFAIETQSGRYDYKASICMDNVYIRTIAEKPLCFELLDFTTFSRTGLTIQDKMHSQYQKNLFLLEASNVKTKECWIKVIEALLWEQLMICKKNRPGHTIVRKITSISSD